MSTLSCGDGICVDSEDCFTCEADCGVCPVTRVVINEVVAKATDDGDDWIEPTTSGRMTHLAGWSVEDSDGNTYMWSSSLVLSAESIYCC